MRRYYCPVSATNNIIILSPEARIRWFDIK